MDSTFIGMDQKSAMNIIIDHNEIEIEIETFSATKQPNPGVTPNRTRKSSPRVTLNRKLTSQGVNIADQLSSQ